MSRKLNNGDLTLEGRLEIQPEVVRKASKELSELPCFHIFSIEYKNRAAEVLDRQNSQKTDRRQRIFSALDHATKPRLPITIDVWEGTSGTSADVPGVGFEMVTVLNW